MPIAASNLIAGAADVYGHIDGDFMENNTYFNHPILPVYGKTFMVANPTENVSSQPAYRTKIYWTDGNDPLILGICFLCRGKAIYDHGME